uniref:Uncharacterized protein n=1 Tax=Sphaerodactylus townsendi TaxID=933632 RepID=A0ACB8EFN6_9SAUR
MWFLHSSEELGRCEAVMSDRTSREEEGLASEEANESLSGASQEDISLPNELAEAAHMWEMASEKEPERVIEERDENLKAKMESGNEVTTKMQQKRKVKQRKTLIARQSSSALDIMDHSSEHAW